MRVLVAGATGVLGRALLPVLVGAGHEVVGTTRSAGRVRMIEAAGGTGVVCDALDRDAVHRTVAAAAPEVVIHQLTALPDSFGKLSRGAEPTNRLRRDGTRHLVDAAIAAGARRVIAESIAFLYPPDRSGPADEREPIWADAPPPYRTMMAALSELERAVTETSGIEGIVLRYGTLYGPGTWYAADGDLTHRLRTRRMPVIGSGAGVTSFLHVDDAATATALALDHGEPGGIYNVADDEPVTFRELLPTLAGLLGAKPPPHLPAWLARPLAGSAGIAVMTRQRGATNDRAKRELGWQPRYPTWRDGFAAELTTPASSES
jgi:2-alkyl-3-oxoalkanoate reductase